MYVLALQKANQASLFAHVIVLRLHSAGIVYITIPALVLSTGGTCLYICL